MSFKNHWDERFSEDEYVYGKEVNHFIKQKSDLLEDSSYIACFAEGEGRNAVYLAKKGHNVTCYDLSLIGLEKTKRLASDNHVEVGTIEKDLTKEKVEEDFYDAAILVFGHVPKNDQRFFIKNLIGTVKKGGIVLLEVYSEEQINYTTGGPGVIDRLYHPIDMLTWIKDYKPIHFYYGEVERNEGKRHTGTGHVIQVVIRK